MTTRVSRCVQSNQTNRWLAFERDDVAVFNKTIHVNVAQHCGGFSVRRHGNSSSEMRFQRVHAANVIGMEMCDDDLAHAPAFGDHFIDALGERLLLVFIWRTRVRSEEHTSELQSPCNLVCRLLLEKKKTNIQKQLTATDNIQRTPEDTLEQS